MRRRRCDLVGCGGAAFLITYGRNAFGFRVVVRRLCYRHRALDGRAGRHRRKAAVA